MPNAITRFSREEFEALEKLLGKKMSPTRWLGLVVQEHFESRRPVEPRVRPRRSSGAGIRVLGHVPRSVDAQIRPARARPRAYSEAELLYWIAAAALEAKRIPKDDRPRPDVALARKVDPKPSTRLPRKKELERRREKDEKTVRVRDEATIERHADGEYRANVATRILPKLLATFRLEVQKQPKISQSAALEEAIAAWLAKRALARVRAPKADLRLGELCQRLPDPPRGAALDGVVIDDRAAPERPSSTLQVVPVSLEVDGVARAIPQKCDAPRCKDGRVDGGRGELGDGDREWSTCAKCGGKGVLHGD